MSAEPSQLAIDGGEVPRREAGADPDVGREAPRRFLVGLFSFWLSGGARPTAAHNARAERAAEAAIEELRGE